MGKLTIWLKLAAAAFFWGAMFHLGKYAVGFLSPETVGAWRFLIAGLVLMVLVKMHEGIDWQGLRRNWLALTAMSCVGVAGMNVFLFYGLQQTSSVNSALIMALCPSLITVLSVLMTDERASWRQVLGLMICLTGVAVVISQGSLQALLSLSFHSGDLLVLCAALCWVAYSIIPHRFIKGLAPLQITTFTLMAGGIQMGLYALHAKPDFLSLPSAGTMAAILAMSLFGSVIAYLWWNDGVRQLGAVRSGLFMNLVPISAVMIGVALGQSLLFSQLVGAALVICGVLFASLKPFSRNLAVRSGETSRS